MQREYPLRLLLTDQESRDIREAAKRAGLPVASYARTTVLHDARTPAMPPTTRFGAHIVETRG